MGRRGQLVKANEEEATALSANGTCLAYRYFSFGAFFERRLFVFPRPAGGGGGMSMSTSTFFLLERGRSVPAQTAEEGERQEEDRKKRRLIRLARGWQKSRVGSALFSLFSSACRRERRGSGKEASQMVAYCALMPGSKFPYSPRMSDPDSCQIVKRGSRK